MEEDRRDEGSPEECLRLLLDCRHPLRLRWHIEQLSNAELDRAVLHRLEPLAALENQLAARPMLPNFVQVIIDPDTDPGRLHARESAVQAGPTAQRQKLPIKPSLPLRRARAQVHQGRQYEARLHQLVSGLL